MKINVLEQHGTRTEQRERVIPAIYDDEGNIIAEERAETYTVEVPVMVSVTRDMTPEEEADMQPTPQTKWERIEELKTLLASTDYQAIKYAEGLISKEDYAPIKQKRQAWRNEINTLEEENLTCQS